MFPGYSVCSFNLIHTSVQVTFEFPVQLVNSHRDDPDSPMAVDDVGSTSKSTSSQKRLKRPRPPQKNAVPEILETPTVPMKKLRLSPDKEPGRSALPSKPGGDYFASVLTDSEEEEGEVNSDGSGKLWLTPLVAVQGSGCTMFDRKLLLLTGTHSQCWTLNQERSIPPVSLDHLQNLFVDS